MGKLHNLSKDGLVQAIKDEAAHHIEAYEGRDSLEEMERVDVEKDYMEFVGHVARLGMDMCVCVHT